MSRLPNRSQPRPLVLELELTIALCYVLLALGALLLEQRLIVLAKEADARIEQGDLRLVRSVSALVVEAMARGELARPSAEGDASDPVLARIAEVAGLDALGLVDAGPPARRSSSRTGISAAAGDPPRLPAGSVVYGTAFEREMVWYGLGPGPASGLSISIQFPAAGYRRVRSGIRLLAAGVPVVLVALGGILLAQIIRVGRKIGRLVSRSIDSGLAGEIEGGQDETALVERTIRRSVTELRRREAELESLLARERTKSSELETVSAALRRNMPGALFAVDADGTVRDLNAKARSLFPDAGEGHAYRDVFASAPELLALVGRALSGQETVVREEVGIERPEGKVVLGVTAVPVSGSEQRFVGVLLFGIDVTALRELERRLRFRETFALLGEIAAGAAHEMRNAVAAASGWCRLVIEDVGRGDTDGARTRLERIRQELAGLERTVAQLLEITRTGPVDVGPVDAERLVREVAEELAGRHPSVRFEVRAKDAVHPLAEPNRLRQIVWNLASNAAQELEAAAPAGGGRIVVSTGGAPPGRFRLSVADNGRGIAADLRERVFVPFVSGREGGTGLGLALVQQYAVSLGGEVRLEEPAASPGATFLVDLPAE